jgi:hypothetical protein
MRYLRISERAKALGPADRRSSRCPTNRCSFHDARFVNVPAVRQYRTTRRGAVGVRSRDAFGRAERGSVAGGCGRSRSPWLADRLPSVSGASRPEHQRQDTCGARGGSPRGARPLLNGRFLAERLPRRETRCNGGHGAPAGRAGDEQRYVGHLQARGPRAPTMADASFGRQRIHSF